MMYKLLSYPLSDSDLAHTIRVWNDVGMIADAVNDRPLTEGFKAFTRKLWTSITMADIMCLGAGTETALALSTPLTHII